MIRTRYMSIVEDILESEPAAGVTQAILDDFKAKHRSGAFFCRHRRCPRAAQGYNTPELRQKHEESHVPKFQCTEVACGFFGWPFNTQAAFKKHTIQYHDEERIASIPDSLATVQCRAHKDRSLFTLTKSKEKRRNDEFYSPRAPSGGILVENDDDELSNPSSPAGVNTATHIRLQQKPEADAHAYAQHHPPFYPEVLSLDTILLKEAQLDNIDNDTKMPLFPPIKSEPQYSSHSNTGVLYRGNTDESSSNDQSYLSTATSRRESSASSAGYQSGLGFTLMPDVVSALPQQYPFISEVRLQSCSDQVPEFPGPLTSMESTRSESGEAENVKLTLEADMIDTEDSARLK